MSKREQDILNEQIEKELGGLGDLISNELPDVDFEDIDLATASQDIDIFEGADETINVGDSDEAKKAKRLMGQSHVSTTKQLIDELKGGEENWRTALKQEVYKHARVLGYLANDDARIDFGVRRDYIKDEEGNLVVIPGMEGELALPKDQQKPKSEIFQREANLNVRYKTPAQQQGLFIALPVKGYEMLGQDLSQDDFNAQGLNAGLGENPEMVVMPVPKNNLIAVLSTFLPGKIRESESIFANYLTPGAKGEVISEDGGQVAELILTITQKTEIDELTGAPVAKLNSRVRHSFRRSFWNYLNFIPLREFKYLDLGKDAAIDSELSYNLNRWYTDNLFKPGRNGAPSPFEVMNANDKRMFTSVGDGMGESTLFTTDLGARETMPIQHWSILQDSNLRQEGFRLPIKSERKPGSGKYVYEVKTLVRDENVEGFNPEEHFTFEDNARFDAVRDASTYGGQTLLTYDLVRRLEEEYKASKKSGKGGRRSSTTKLEGLEAALVASNQARFKQELGGNVESNLTDVSVNELLNLVPRG